MRRSLILLGLGLLLTGGLELLLRRSPELLNPRMGNVVYSRYGEFPGGIYYREPHSDIRVMRRRHRDELYFNGYRWDHATDGHGFRNPDRDLSKQVLLLGGSLVYGHGVGSEEVVSELLRKRGWGAYNMARQGDGLYESYVLLRTFLEEYQPRQVVLFAFHNDLADLDRHPARDTLLAGGPPPELETLDYALVRRGIFAQNAPVHSLARRARYGVLALRFGRAVGAEASARLDGLHAGDGEALPPYVIPLLAPKPIEVAEAYYGAILGDLSQRCQELGVQLSVVHLHAHQAGRSADHVRGLQRFVQLLEESCTRAGIPFHDTVSRFEGRGDCFLLGDGHFNSKGHRELVDFLERWVLAPRPEKSSDSPLAGPPEGND